MTEKEKKTFERYCRRVKRVCPPSLRRRLADDLRDHAEEFLAASPTHDMAGFLESAGEPAAFAAAFKASVPPEEQRRLAAKHRRVRIALLAVGIALVVAVLGFCLYIFIESDPFATYTTEYSTTYHTTVIGG